MVVSVEIGEVAEKTSRRRWRGGRNGRRYSLPQPTRDLGERRKLPTVWGQSPDRKRFGEIWDCRKVSRDKYKRVHNRPRVILVHFRLEKMGFKMFTYLPISSLETLSSSRWFSFLCDNELCTCVLSCFITLRVRCAVAVVVLCVVFAPFFCVFVFDFFRAFCLTGFSIIATSFLVNEREYIDDIIIYIISQRL